MQRQLKDPIPKDSKKISAISKQKIMASAQFEVEERTDLRLKYLDFVRILALHFVAAVSTLYDHVRQNSGPLKSTLGTVEKAVTAVVSPAYSKFKDVPAHLLIFLDKKVEVATQMFDKYAPLVAKDAASKGQVIVLKLSHVARDLVKEAQDSGPLAAICHAGTISKQATVNQLVSLWWKINHKYPAAHGATEMAATTVGQWSEKYNKLVKDLAAKGYSLFNYFPLVPVEEIVRAYKQLQAAAYKKTDTASSSGSESDKD